MILARGCCAAAQQDATAAAAAQSAPSLSSQLQPKLQLLRQVIEGLDVERWKATKSVKGMMAADIESARRDLQKTLPGLISAADTSPNSLLALLEVSRNLGALYDVALRVAVVADNAATQMQAQAMADALASLDSGRQALSDRLHSTAEIQDRQVVELRTSVAQLKAASAAVAVPPSAPLCPAPAVKKKKVASKPAVATPPPV